MRWAAGGLAVAAGSVLTVAAVAVALPERADGPPAGVVLAEAPPATGAPDVPQAPAAPSPSDDNPAPDAWNPDVVELVHFVERERELTFVHPVDVALLSDDDYVAGIGGHDDGSLGYYDGQRVVGRGTELTPAVEGTLVHELTHALDDQHFDVFALDHLPDVSGEGWLAYEALVEGDAIRMEWAYDEMLMEAGVDPDDLTDPVPTEPEHAGAVGGGVTTTVAAHGRQARSRVPRLLAPVGPVTPAGTPAPSGPLAPSGSAWQPYGSEIASLGDALDISPYHIGEQLLDALVHEGGNAAVDAAFRDPPATTEQVLDPRAYLDREEPLTVASPQPGAAADDVRTQETVGALNLYLVLATGIDPLLALDAATGWGGESAVSYEDAAGHRCLDLAAVGDTEADTAEIGEAFAAWVDGDVAARATTSRRDDGAHVLTACDLHAAVGPSGIDPMEALTLAETRGVEMWAAMRLGGLGVEAAFDFAHCLVHEVPLTTLLAAGEDDDSVAALEAERRRAAERC